MDALRKLLMKKQGESKMLSPIEKDAKMSVLQSLHKDMSDSMASKLGGLKKVTVAADSQGDLAHGLDKAKELLGKTPEHDDSEMADDEDESQEDPAEEMHESPEEELAEEHDEDPMDHEDAHMSEEELDAKLKQLMALKASRHA